MLSMNTAHSSYVYDLNYHQTQLSINSIASLVEPVTPPDLSFQFDRHLEAPPLDLSIGSGTGRRHKSIGLGFDMALGAHPGNLGGVTGHTVAAGNVTGSVTSGGGAAAAGPPVTTAASAGLSAVPHDLSLAIIPGLHSKSSSLSSDFGDVDYIKLATDQFGCRHLQKKLEADPSLKDAIFQQVFPKIYELVIDPFGNYLVQKLVEYLTVDERTMVIERIYQKAHSIAINQYGTRSLQKIIDTVTTAYQVDLITSGLCQGNLVELVNDLNANHVVQKCIFKFSAEQFQFIIDAICMDDNIIKVSTHKHGCCVLQKLLNVSNINQIFKISIKALQFLTSLINDQFGNYIIQFLFDIRQLDAILVDDFAAKLGPQLVSLSCFKFSSNVIEKYVKKCMATRRFDILSSIIGLVTANLELLIKDKFGNYVVQSLLDREFYLISDPQIQMMLFQLIVNVKSFLPMIKNTSYAKKIKLKVRAMEEFSKGPVVSNAGYVFTQSPFAASSAAFQAHTNPYRGPW